MRLNLLLYPLNINFNPYTHFLVCILFNCSIQPTCSIMIKTLNDNWVAGRLCNSREIYIVLNQKLTKLNDVDSEYMIMYNI